MTTLAAIRQLRDKGWIFNIHISGNQWAVNGYDPEGHGFGYTGFKNLRDSFQQVLRFKYPQEAALFDQADD